MIMACKTLTSHGAGLSAILILISIFSHISSAANISLKNDRTLHGRAINEPPNSSGGRGFTTVGPETGRGRFTNPLGGETWYVGDTHILSWELEDTIHPNWTNQNGLINTGMLLFSYPNTSIQQKSDYDVKHTEWNLTDHGGSIPWFITNACIGVNKCYFMFHYFFDDRETAFAFIYSKNITILAEKPTSTSASEVSGPTGSTTSQPAATTSAGTSDGGGKTNNTKIIAPIAAVGSLLLIGVAVFIWYRWKKSRLQDPPDLGGYPIYKFELDAGKQQESPNPQCGKGVELPAGQLRAHEADSNVVHELLSSHHRHELPSTHEYELPANEEPQRPGSGKPYPSAKGQEIEIGGPPPVPAKDKR